jgi:hypothetical protein
VGRVYGWSLGRNSPFLAVAKFAKSILDFDDYSEYLE